MPSIHKPLALLFLLASVSFASPLSLGSSGKSLGLDKELVSDSKRPRNEPAPSQDQCQDRFQQVLRSLADVQEKLDGLSGGTRKNEIQDSGPKDVLGGLRSDRAAFGGKDGDVVGKIVGGIIEDGACGHGAPAKDQGKEDGGHTRPGADVQADANV